jgi:hypothetical protein
MEILATYRHDGSALHLTALPSEAAGAAKGAERLEVRAPGAGTFEFGTLGLTGDDQGIALAGQVAGRNLAYLFVEVLLKDPDRDRFYGPVAREYVRAEREKETGGVERPDWGDPAAFQAKISAGLRVVTDGTRSAFCFAVPEGYGSPDYCLGGLYTRAAGDGSPRALLVFSADGRLKSVTAYEEQGGHPGPRTIVAARGDRFAPFAQVLTPGGPAGTWAVATAVADELVCGDRSFSVATEALPPGGYLAGVLAQDLDGGFTRKYVEFSVG